MKVWVAACKTESGDEFFYVFKTRPTDEDFVKRLEKDFPEEFEYVGFINYDFSQTEILE